MKEIEIKILEIKPKEITKKLIDLGAKKISEELIIEKIFDFPDGRIDKNDRLFRLRKVGDKVEIGYKEQRSKDKEFQIREEIETEVKDFNIMTEIITKLGFKCIKYREKKRTSFVKDKLKFEIDQYPKIPPYLEIEGLKEEIEQVVELLGFDMKKTVNITATEVLKSYKADPFFQKF